MFGYRTIGFGGKASRGGCSGPGDRGLYGGGETNRVIDYITISTTGNAIDFGDLLNYQQQGGVCNGGCQRGLFSGGNGGWPEKQNELISYVTVDTLSDAVDTGDLTEARRFMAGVSNGTDDRGVYMGGYVVGGSPPERDTIEYVTISTAGNATDFGDLLVGTRNTTGVSNASDRGVTCNGRVAAVYQVDTLQYITISTTGNATDFGDATTASYMHSGCSNDTGDRGIYGGGYNHDASGAQNFIDYITISTTGAGTDFGDLTSARYQLSSCSNGGADRGTFGGGATNVIDYVTISSTGDATDFGDLTGSRTIEDTALSNGQT